MKSIGLQKLGAKRIRTAIEVRRLEIDSPNDLPKTQIFLLCFLC